MAMPLDLSGDTYRKGRSRTSLTFYKKETHMADKLMYIPNDNTHNYPFCRLKLVVEMFEHSTSESTY